MTEAARKGLGRCHAVGAAARNRCRAAFARTLAVFHGDFVLAVGCLGPTTAVSSPLLSGSEGTFWRRNQIGVKRQLDGLRGPGNPPDEPALPDGRRRPARGQHFPEFLLRLASEGHSSDERT
jgi:hypothetical protein